MQHDRYDEKYMAETMYSDRAARDAAKGKPTVDRKSYLKGVHDAIEFLNGISTAGVSHEIVTGMMGEMSQQTTDKAIEGNGPTH
jgi:hypothetical protein